MSDAFVAAENAVLAAMREEAQRRRKAAWMSAALLIAASTLAMVFARHPRGGVYVVCAAIGVLATALLLLWRRTSRPLFVVSAAASASLTALAARAGGVPVGGGIHCATVEIVAAALPSLVVLFAARKNGDPIDVWKLTQTALLGGLGGQAALLVACPSNETLGHLLLFHNFGLIAAAALIAGLALWQRRRQL